MVGPVEELQGKLHLHVDIESQQSHPLKFKHFVATQYVLGDEMN